MWRILSVAVLSAGLLAAETPSLTLLVGNKDESSLAFVDPASGKVLGRVPTGEGPHEVAASADGKLAFVANYGTGPNPGSTISVIDAVNMKEIRKLDVSPMRRPHGLFFANGKLYFTAEANRLIGTYDPAANMIDWLMGTGQNTTHMVMVGRDNLIFTANIGSDTITIIDRAGETPVPVGKGPEGFDVSPDGKFLWAAHSRDGGVSIIDIAAKKVVGTINLATKRSNRLKFTPDGKHVLISDLDAGDIVVVDVASRKETQRIPMGKAPEGILMAKDGSKAYIAVNGDHKIAVLDLATMKVIGNLETGKGPDGMAWADRR
jgi:YVTN family beta-propeller protein